MIINESVHDNRVIISEGVQDILSLNNPIKIKNVFEISTKNDCMN
jgi:hypothetical protein